MPHIDTLATARRLELAGLPTEQARAVSEAISDAIRDSQPDLSNLTTKSDLANLAAQMATKADLKDLEVRIMDRLRSQMIWFYSVQAAFVGIGVTLIKLLSK
jgi:hypothetical protein